MHKLPLRRTALIPFIITLLYGSPAAAHTLANDVFHHLTAVHHHGVWLLLLPVILIPAGLILLARRDRS